MADSTALELDAYIDRIKTLHNHWEPQPHQGKLIKAMFSDGYKRIFVRGGRKSAKTESILYCSARVSASGRNKVTSIIAPQLKQQRKIIWNNRRLHDFFPKSWGGEIRESENRICFPWGSYIEIDGADNAEVHRGEEQDLIVLDELKDHESDSYEALYPNLLARDGILLVAGSPPRTKRNLFYQLEQKALKDAAWKCFHWRSWDNGKVSKEWLEREKASYYARGDGDIWESEYEGRYIFGGKKAVFSVFDKDKHVLPLDVIKAILAKDAHKLEYFIISDPGNRACHANLFIAFNRHNNRIYVLDEVYETLISETATGRIYPRIQEKSQKLFPKGKVSYWVYDEAALWFTNEVSAQFPDAPPMCPTNKSARNKETSMGVIKDCMVAGNIIISDQCPQLVEEITGYYLDEKDRYIKVFDHAIDCLRYFFDFVNYSYVLKPEEHELSKEDQWIERVQQEETKALSPFSSSDTLVSESDDFLSEEFLWN